MLDSAMNCTTTTDNAEYDDDCSFRPLLLTTGQLEEGEDGQRSAKVMKVVGDGGWSIPSGTGEQWMPGRCVGEVRGKMNGVNCVPKMMLVYHFLHRQDVRTSILARWGHRRGC